MLSNPAAHLMYQQFSCLAEHHAVAPGGAARVHVVLSHPCVLHVRVAGRKVDRELKQLLCETLHLLVKLFQLWQTHASVEPTASETQFSTVKDY